MSQIAQPFYDVKLVNSLLRKEKTVIPYKAEFFSAFLFAISKVVVSSIGRAVMIFFTINPLYRSSYTIHCFIFIHQGFITNQLLVQTRIYGINSNCKLVFAFIVW